MELSVYKVGDWLKHKHTGQLLEIAEEVNHPSGRTAYLLVGKDLDTDYVIQYDTDITLNLDLCPAARLLYGTSVRTVLNGDTRDIWYGYEIPRK